MSDLVYIIAFFTGFIWWNIAILYYAPKISVQKWKEWALTDDGQDTLVEVLNAEDGVIDHISAAAAETLKLVLQGGFGQVAKQLKNSNPQIAMATGISKELKNMKWYESALLMKVAQQIPALQPLLGLVPVVNQSKSSEELVTLKPVEASK